MGHGNVFQLADYFVFGIMLVISAGIGVVFGFVDRKKKSAHDFLLGGGDLNVFPVGISILASFTSAIAILGYSSEMYKFGTMYWMILVSYPLTQGLTALVYIPHFHRLGITSAYQYLELRFNHKVKLATSVIFCLQMFLYMAVALYTPALAIEQVTGIPLFLSIVSTGAICSVYTVIGGMKATVWIDTFQVGIMFLGLIVVIVKGAYSIEGGMSEIWERSRRGDRLDFFDFDISPFRRHTFWTLFFGGFLTNLTIYGSNQGTIQRYLTIKSWTDASKALMINLVGGMILLTLTCLCGLVAYAKYYDCDLIGSGNIDKGEQMLPYLVMDILGNLPGLPGLFVATVYSAALSTISAGMNSLAAVCITDFYKPHYEAKHGHPIDENKAGKITKALALSFGIASIGLAYMCKYLGNTVLQLALSIFGILGGPVLAVITMGMFFPYANWVGALTGLVSAAVINFWIGAGAVLFVKPPQMKVLTTAGCPFDNSTSDYLTTTAIMQTTMASQQPESEPFILYRLSYLYYAAQAFLVVFSVGTIASYVGYKKGWAERKPVDRKYYVNSDIYKASSHMKAVEAIEAEAEHIDMEIKAYKETHPHKVAPKVHHEHENGGIQQRSDVPAHKKQADFVNMAYSRDDLDREDDEVYVTRI